MPTLQDYLEMPTGERLERMHRTSGELEEAIARRSEKSLSRRPDSANWSAKEVVCHLRDMEELFILRFRTMLALQEPTFLVMAEMPPDPAAWGIAPEDPLPLDPERWAEERQYLSNDTSLALAAFHRRREETLIVLKRLAPAEWERGSIHVTLGRMNFGDWIALVAAHDDKHLAQLRRALDGLP